MEHNEEVRGNAEFGAYLKRVREGRRLSLDAVEELSAGFPEKVTKSHLSRIENGLALPTFPRLMAMSHIYGVPIASLAERYEIDLRRGMTPVDLGGKSEDEVLKEVDALQKSGNPNDALLRLLLLIDKRSADDSSEGAPSGVPAWELRLQVADCLIQLGRFEFAKAICEELLGDPIPSPRRLVVVLQFAIACYRLGRHSVALMALDQVAAEIDRTETPRRLAADLEFVRGNALSATGAADAAIPRLERARSLYEQIPFPYEACRASLALAGAMIDVGRTDEAGVIVNEELARAEKHGFERQRALALSHLAFIAFGRSDAATSETLFLRSNSIARTIEFHELVFRNCFYLWELAKRKGDASAVKLNERTLRIYLGRIETALPEAQTFREFVGRGQS